MLDKNALQQLSQLKKEIDNSKERHSATVKGTQWRYGFALLDNGRQILIPADEMQKVLPGDRVHLIVVRDEKNKPVAELEKLIKSDLELLTGQIKKKGKNSFVVPDAGNNLSRWLFIPPRQLSGANEGDYVQCKITQHPFKNGKPQVKITQLIGAEAEAGIERKYILFKHALGGKWPEGINDSLAEDCQKIFEREKQQREDLCSLPFFTIDAKESSDLDDALHIEKSDTGNWQLSVAIADPTAFIAPDSPLDQLARERITSIYLPGKTLPMLPEAVSNDCCSLLPEQQRLAIVCRLLINKHGEIQSTTFSQALIKSRQRLNYFEADAIIQGSNDEEPADGIKEQLLELWQLRLALFEQRKKNNLVMEESPDYQLRLNEQQKICEIHRIERNDAHRLVEECMLAANSATALYLSEHTDSALYIGHAGFRSEKHDNINKLITQTYPDYSAGDLNLLDNYRALIHHIKSCESATPAYSVLSKTLTRSEITDKPSAHLGMGLECYTTFTSPLRKYHDFLVHRIIKSLINKETPEILPATTIEHIQAISLKTKQASRELEQWLKCQYIAGKAGQEFPATIAHIHSRGINLRLDDSDIQGHIDAKTLGEKYKYDPILMELQLKDHSFKLEQKIQVRVLGIDQRKKTAQLALVK